MWWLFVALAFACDEGSLLTLRSSFGTSCAETLPVPWNRQDTARRRQAELFRACNATHIRQERSLIAAAAIRC